MTDEPDPRDVRGALGIGAVSKATGIPVGTLRTWERRYGVPRSMRSAGGHRLYEPATVDHLRLVQQALQSGMRPSQVLTVDPAEVAQLLGGLDTGSSAPAPRFGTSSPLAPVVQEWVEAAARLDGEALERGFQVEAARLGLQGFIDTRMVPFLEAIGSTWAEGRLSVAHEHHASEHLRAFLERTRRAVEVARDGPVAVCTGLRRERHLLGLHLAAIVLAQAGWRVVFLGGDLPATDILATARQSGAAALVVSISSTIAPDHALRELQALSVGVDGALDLVVGGAGAPIRPDSWVTLEGLDDLREWASGRSGS